MRTKSIIFLFLSIFTVSAFAAANSPVTMLKNSSDKLLSQLRKEKASINKNPEVVYRLVEKILLPHVDTTGMARSVLGRNVWGSATADQKKRFTKEFTKLVTRTYSSALAAYQDEDIKFMPIRGDVSKMRRAQVDSLVISRGKPNIPVSYRLIKKGNTWKVYDMTVEGVSLLSSFRSQFSSELSQGSLDQLIQRLVQHNRENT